MALIEVTDGTFHSEVLRADMPVLVDFWAPWCGPCKAMMPHLDALAEEFKARLRVVKVNTDHSATAQRYGIASIPTLLLFKDGALVSRRVGAGSRDELRQFVAEALR